MKIVVIGDIHGKLNLTVEMQNAIKDADLLFLNGDLTDFGEPSRIHALIDELKKHTDAEIKAVPGNCDTPDGLLEMERIGINMHRSAKIVDDLGIMAVGGSNETPFGTPIEFTEADIEQFLLETYELVKDCRTVILFSHVPPKDTAVDIISIGAHVGSQSLREFILNHSKLKLVVCGHIHEAKGVDSLGETLIVNHGMGAEGHFVTVDANKGESGAWDITFQEY